MKSWEIWSEGYQMWPELSERSGATYIGSAWGDSFRDACIAANKYGLFEGYGDFNPERLSLWACRLFDSEEKARRSFG